MNPVISYSSNLPSSWRQYVDYAASSWNAAGTKLQIRRLTTVVNAGVAQDGKNVICYGPEPPPRLGVTYTWFNTLTGFTTEVDIQITSTQSLSIGGGATSYDVWSVLTHEFGHFCGLDHVADRTQTMFEGIPPDCVIYRTLCAGDLQGIRALYP
jgi:hypothetical protein